MWIGHQSDCASILTISLFQLNSRWISNCWLLFYWFCLHTWQQVSYRSCYTSHRIFQEFLFFAWKFVVSEERFPRCKVLKLHAQREVEDSRKKCDKFCRKAFNIPGNCVREYCMCFYPWNHNDILTQNIACTNFQQTKCIMVQWNKKKFHTLLWRDSKWWYFVPQSQSEVKHEDWSFRCKSKFQNSIQLINKFWQIG